MKLSKLSVLLFLFIGSANVKAQTVNCFDSCDVSVNRILLSVQTKPVKVGDTLSLDFSWHDKIYDGHKGCVFPDKPLYRLDGSAENMKKHRGNLVYVFFTYVGEGDYLPHQLNVINKLITEFKQDDVEFVTLFLDQGDMTEQFLQKVPYNGIVYQIPTMDGFCMLSRPMNMLLDKQGALIKMWAESTGFDAKAEEATFNEIKNLIKSNL